jgi:hypothetical protein
VQIASCVESQMSNGMIHGRTRAFAVTDRLRHGGAPVVKLCCGGNRQCFHLSSLL